MNRKLVLMAEILRADMPYDTSPIDVTALEIRHPPVKKKREVMTCNVDPNLKAVKESRQVRRARERSEAKCKGIVK